MEKKLNPKELEVLMRHVELEELEERVEMCDGGLDLCMCWEGPCAKR